jgi:hypothetical protein
MNQISEQDLRRIAELQSLGKINFKDPKVLREFMNKIGMATGAGVGGINDPNLSLDSLDHNIHETLEKYIQSTGAYL